MTRVEAIYENKTLQLTEPLPLQQHQRVELEVIVEKGRPGYARIEVREKPISGNSALDALARVSAGREKLRQVIGTLPDSTPLIREDRMRDI